MTIAEEYIPLARSLAKKYTPRGQHFETSDCMSVAYMAAVQAAHRMEDRETGTSTYMKKSIEGALKRHLTTQRTQGFAGLKRSKYAEAMIMDKDIDTPEELEGPMMAALTTTLGLDEPTHFDDGEQGALGETIDPCVPSVEDEYIERHDQEWAAQELFTWKQEKLSSIQRLYFDEVMVGDSTQAQFCKDHHIGTERAKNMCEAITEEYGETASYIGYTMGWLSL